MELFAAAAAGAVAALLASACGEPETGPAVTRVPLDRLPPGERLRLLHGETPVELQRTADGVAARSLWCTHYGCEVEWSPAAGVYVCPCHEGFFDADGRVLSGPPPRALRRVESRVEGDMVVLGLVEP